MCGCNVSIYLFIVVVSPGIACDNSRILFLNGSNFKEWKRKNNVYIRVHG